MNRILPASRRDFLRAMGLGSCAVALGYAASGETIGRRALPERPNILLIQADDLGFDDVGTNGNRTVETPQLDRLARESVQLAEFNVCSVCAPTRASLLTGRHFWRTGVSGVHAGKDFLGLDEVTLADSLRRGGYATGMWGKWHSGKTDGYFPWERGFDQAFMARLYDHQDNAGTSNGRPEQTSGPVAQAITDKALGFIEQNQDRPFLAYVSYLTCHAPWVAPAALVQKYRDRGLSEALATLYGMIDEMDQQVGRLLARLDALDLTRNTVVVFLSDNGPERYDSRLGQQSDRDWADRNGHGLRGQKGQNFENGVKSILLARWPGRFRPATVERLVDITDLYPTLLDLAGVGHAGALPLDGRSVAPYLLGDTRGLGERRAFIAQWHPFEFGKPQEHNPVVNKAGLRFEEQSIAIRDERYKLSYFWGQGYLFDLKNDPQEKTNLLASRPDLVRPLRDELVKWFEGIKREPGSFVAPEFQIGLDRKTQSLVLACGPSRVGGNVQNHNFDVDGFQKRGDFAEYRIRVRTAGAYRIGLAYDAPQGPGKAELHLRVQGVDGKTVVPTEKWWVESAPLSLPAGPHTLRLELASDAMPFDRLREIYLSRVP